MTKHKEKSFMFGCKGCEKNIEIWEKDIMARQF